MASLVVLLLAALGLVSAMPASASVSTYAYDIAAYTYDAPALLSTPSATATDVRGSPAGPGAVSWGRSVSVRGCCVAANTGATLSGRTVLGEGWDAAIRSARNATPEAGYFDVVAHGTPNAVFDAAGNALSPSQLATVVRGTPSWAGQDVRLLSCSTGCSTGSFAQSLANELGVGVKAPTTLFQVNSRGGAVFDPGGSWAFFSPGG